MTIKITPEAVKERIAALESAGELSLKEQFYLEALRHLVASMDSEPVAWLLSGGGTKNVVCFDSGNAYADPLREVTPLYRHAQPVPVVPDSCTWHCEEDINNWHSDCGYQFQFMEDGPEENGVKFCPKCGKSVAIPATE